MKRLASALALVIAATTFLTGCSTKALIPGSEISIAQLGKLDSINPDVSAVGNEHNAGELANLTTSRFYDLDATGELVANEQLGTVEVVTKKPLVVKYTIAENATWSDGTPIDSADLALSFATGSSLAGVYFQSIRIGTGISAANLDGEVKSGNSLTLRFEHPVADYQSALTLSVPAHVVAKILEPSLNPSDGKQEIIDIVNTGDVDKLQAIADVYRSAFALDQLSTTELDSLSVSSGPYRVTNVAGTKITLIANDGYLLGSEAKVESVTLTYFADSTAAVAEMVAGSVDVSSAEDSGLVSLGEIQKLAEESSIKITSVIAAGAVSEQILLNFAAGSLFADGTTSESAEKALALRKAFLLAIPKQRILIQTSTRYTTSVSDSFVFDSGSDYYQTTVHDNGSAEYLIQDLEKSSEMLAAAEVRTPLDIRVVFDSDNPRAQSEWLLLQDRAVQIGFNLINISSSDPSRVIARGEFDVLIAPRDLMSAPTADIFQLSGNSVTSFRNAKVDSLLEQFAASSGIKQKKLLKDIDTQLFASGYGLALYEVPSMLLYSERVKGFVASPHCFSATWGYYNWSVPAKK